MYIAEISEKKMTVENAKISLIFNKGNMYIKNKKTNFVKKINKSHVFTKNGVYDALK